MATKKSKAAKVKFQVLDIPADVALALANAAGVKGRRGRAMGGGGGPTGTQCEITGVLSKKKDFSCEDTP